MPIDPVKIPQNVQIEDRIVGPLTLRQLIIMMLGGGFSYALFATLQKAYGKLPVPVVIMVWLPAVVAALFAVIKVNDLSLTRICFLFFERMKKPSVRTWAPRRGISINIRTSAESDEKPQHIAAVQRQESEIAQLSSVVDQTLPAHDVQVAVSPAPAAATAHVFSAQPTVAEVPAPTPTAPATEPARPRPPVNPNKISADGATPAPNLPTPDISDLSVFRDVFPQNS